MKKFLGRIFSKKATTSVALKPEKQVACTFHNNERYPHIKSNENCIDCGIQMCYMCGNHHLERKCTINWGNSSEFHNFALLEKNNQKLHDFNKGFLSLLKLDGLKCLCGEPIGSNGQGGICVACSNAVCSKECHQKHLEANDSCVFHKNFTKDLLGASMISILFKNVKKIYEKPYPIGFRINKTSPAFVKAFTSPKTSFIYLQRGFRQYGVPKEETLNNLEVMPKINLDFIMNKERSCYCDCMACKLRSKHPVKNCSLECSESDELSITELFKRDDFKDVCECDCSFCKSGVTIMTHNKEDCLYYCAKNNVKRQGF